MKTGYNTKHATFLAVNNTGKIIDTKLTYSKARSMGQRCPDLTIEFETMKTVGEFIQDLIDAR